MGIKKEIDPGLKYLQEIGFTRLRGQNGLYRKWERAFGRDKASRMMMQWEKLKFGSPEFYDFKNSSPEISQGFSEAFDGDIIRNACNYIDAHKEYFGKTILEVGTDIGYMTCFIAKTFPESKIVSIDRNSKAIEIAKGRAQKLKIENIEFLNCSLQEVDGKFDTVFCMRTIQENINSDDTPYCGEPIVTQFFQYAELTREYTDHLIAHLDETGYLCCFERVGHDPLMCGWLIQLSKMNCGMLTSSYQEYSCEENGDTSVFQAFVCKPGINTSEQEIVHMWYKAIDVDPTGANQLTLWNALSYLNDNAGKLIRGIRIFDPDGYQVGRYALFTDCDDDNLIYYLQATNNNIQLNSANVIEKEKILEHIQFMSDEHIKRGFPAEEIDPDDPILERKLK